MTKEKVNTLSKPYFVIERRSRHGARLWKPDAPREVKRNVLRRTAHGSSGKLTLAMFAVRWCSPCGTDVPWLRPMDTGRAARVLQRLQDLDSVVVEQLDRSLLEAQNGVVLCCTEWTTSIGQEVKTRVLGKEHRWFGSEGVWPNWSLVKAYSGAVDQQLSEDVGISADVVSNGQLGSVQLGVVLTVACTGRDMYPCKGSTRLECKGMAEDVSDGFPEERCKACSADDDGIAVDVGHERYCVGDATNAKISERSADSVIVCWC